MKPKYFVPILLSMSLTLSACNMPTSSGSSPNDISTSAAQTVQAVLTPAATQTLLIAGGSATPTSMPGCEDVAMYTAWTRDNILFDVKEVNKPLAPNTVFNMSWTLQNTGACTWDSTYQFYFDSGVQLTDATQFPIIPTGETVPPGDMISITIPMTAPDKVGEYQSVFRLQNDRGESVLNLGVTTKVGTTSTGSIAKPGDLRYTYDCTSGTVNVNLFWLDKAGDEDGYRIYRDGNKLADVPADSTSYNDILPYSGKFDYAVAAFNGGGESSASVKVNTSNCK